MKRRESEPSKSKRAAAGGRSRAAAGGSRAARAPRDASKAASYLSVCSRPDDGASTPIFSASNPIGDALLATGVASLAGSSLAAVAPLLPVAIAGLHVREALHRADVNADAPTLERGLATTNSVGERLGTLTMRWLLAPDDFEVTPGVPPPPTPIDPARSQRFAMLDGTIQFQDPRQGGLKFFGAGRTFPSSGGGASRLEFAGAAAVLEGLGGLKGLRGALMVSGHLIPPAGIAVSLVARFEGHGLIEADDSLAAILDPVDADDQTAVVTLVGEPDADHPNTLSVASDGGVRAARVSERLKLVRIGNDLRHAQQLRSLIREGAVVGTVTGPLSFDPTDRRCGVRLGDARRLFTFTDATGRTVGTIAADPLEGTGFRETRQDEAASRLVAYGPLSAGTGALSGAAGVLTLDAIVGKDGATASVYALRFFDAQERFRTVVPAAGGPAGEAVTPQGGTVDTLRFVSGKGTAAINATDKTILGFADKTLAEGMELERWFEAKDVVGDYQRRFDVMREFNPDDRSFGFFDEAVVGGRPIPVMGIVQEMFYDRQKKATGEAIRPQFKEFILRYFMRVSHFRQPEAATEAGRVPPSSPYLRSLSWLPEEVESQVGFGYEQLYYKLAATKEIGKFHKHEQHAIVDLRDIGRVYDWIVLKVDIFDFNLSFAPFGSDAPKMTVPLKESTYLVLGPPFVRNADKPEPGVLGEYGYGYAFLPYAPEPGVVAYGPGHFAAAIQTINFKVMQSGEIRARASFIVNRPDKIVKLDVDPVDWGFKLANLMTFNFASQVMGPVRELADRLPLRVTDVDPITAYIWLANAVSGGHAAEQLGISKEQLERRMLVQHFQQHYAMLMNSLLVWRMVSDWTDHDHLPNFCNQGFTIA